MQTKTVTLPSGTRITLSALQESQVDRFHQLRLSAARDFPKAFGPSYAQLKEMSAQQCRVLYQQEWSCRTNFIATAWHGERLVGALGLRRQEEGNARHIAVLWGTCVEPGYQGQGIGRLLLSEVRSQAEKIADLTCLKLEVSACQKPALALYKSLGFKPFGREPKGLLVAGEYIDVIHMSMEFDHHPFSH